MRSDRSKKSVAPGVACVLLGLALVLLGACGKQDDLESHTCPTSSAVTYDDFGKQFFDTWCQSCHAAAQTERNGAPDDVFFDTRDDIYRLRVQVYDQAAGSNGSMPIGPHGPSDADREKLADWLSCGAP